jgi:hypothetical protein
MQDVRNIMTSNELQNISENENVSTTVSPLDYLDTPPLPKASRTSENVSKDENVDLNFIPSDSFCCSSSDVEVLDDNKLQKDLQHLFLKNPSIPQTFQKDLLKVLKRYHPDLPIDPRTLLGQKNTKVITSSMAPGKYFHFGLLQGLHQIMDNLSYQMDSIQIQLNVDGTPLFKSAMSVFWPIICGITDVESSLFLVGLYFGPSKPESSQVFLEDTIKDLKMVLFDGFMHKGRHISVALECFCCDTPARSFIKGTKGHSGYFGCDYCVQKGVYIDGVVAFPEISAVRRTNASFRNQSQESHHRYISPLIELQNFDLVCGLPLDYMHSVCKGVVLSLLDKLKFGNVPYRCSRSIQNVISERLYMLRAKIPTDFQRRPRSLNHVAMWKASELRLFLLYLSPCVLLNSGVHEEYYKNFMLLSLIMRILCDKNMCYKLNTYVYDLVKTFIAQIETMYGQRALTYNCHTLIHLVEQTQIYGNVDKFSCFKFESFIHFLKKTIRSANNPLEQAVNRINEVGQSLSFQSENRQEEKSFYFFTPGNAPNVPGSNTTYFLKYCLKSTVLKGNSPDAFICVASCKCFKISYFAKSTSGIFMIGRKIATSVFHPYPLLSNLGIYIASPNLDRRVLVVPVADFQKKLICVKVNNTSIVAPIIHTAVS